MMRFVLLSVVAVFACTNDASAFGKRRAMQTYNHSFSTSTHTTPHGTSTVTRESVSGNSALAEVNACRLARGLRPFIEDANLKAGAEACATARAAHRIAGHTANDFAYLPPGCSAKAGGAGALDISWGWASCCTYDNYQYAGAAYVWGQDPSNPRSMVRYMQLFVR